MKILIDINHPAHVHYFKNFIWIMSKKGHTFTITTRNKEFTLELLNNYKINYHNRGNGGKGILKKLLYLCYANSYIYKIAKQFQPDIFLSFASAYAAQVSFLCRKPHIAFDDTEHAKFEHWMYVPFTDVILTPSCFYKKFNDKQIYFNGFMELCSLHHNYYQANDNIFKILGIAKATPFALLRFVSWEASHDLGHSGIDYKTKSELIKLLSKSLRVFISSEKTLPTEFKPYQISIPPDQMHQVLANATLFIGEGATMASECAMLGTPAIYINSLTAGTIEEQQKHGLLFSYRNSNEVLKKTIELLSTPNLKQEFQLRRQKMLADKIDVTAFMVWFVENYPESVRIMQENPDYQYRFK